MKGRVITGELHRVRGRATVFEEEAPEPSVPVHDDVTARPAPVAVMLALAWKIQGAIDRGEVKDRAEVARMMGVSRARVTQILDLTLLSPEVQENTLRSAPNLWSERALRSHRRFTP